MIVYINGKRIFSLKPRVSLINMDDVITKVSNKFLYFPRFVIL